MESLNDLDHPSGPSLEFFCNTKRKIKKNPYNKFYVMATIDVSDEDKGDFC